MSFLGWMVGLHVADSLLKGEAEREVQDRKNKELARENERLKNEQQWLRERIESLEREARRR